MDRLWMLLHTFKQTFRGPSSFVKSKTCYVISIAFLSFLTSFCCLYRCLSLKESPPVTGSMRKRERAGERPQPSTGLHRLGASLVIGKISSLRLSEQFLVFALRSLHNRDKREREREREKLVIVRHSTLPLLALPSESRALYTSWYLYRKFSPLRIDLLILLVLRGGPCFHRFQRSREFYFPDIRARFPCRIHAILFICCDIIFNLTLWRKQSAPLAGRVVKQDRCVPDSPLWSSWKQFA